MGHRAKRVKLGVERQPLWSDLELAIKIGTPLKEITTLLDNLTPTTMWRPSPEGGAWIAAVSERRDDVVSLLLDRGVDINIVGESGSALTTAAFKGFLSTVYLLLDRGADISVVGGKYGSALVSAASEGWMEIVSLLLDWGADINLVGGEYGTALAAAACAGRTRTVSLLLDRGADIDMVGGEFGTVLIATAFKGRINIVQLLLDRRADINAVSGKYGTALAAAAFEGFEPIVELLLDREADINAVGGKYGSALAAASFKGLMKTTSLLLDRGANINIVGGEYGTALAAAAFGGKISIVPLLLDRGADINAVGGKYGTALAAAAFEGFEPIVELLLDRGANINAVSGEYGTALAAAAFQGFRSTVELLLGRGADINMVGGIYGPALTAAIFQGSQSMVELLLDRGADINMVGGIDGTALATAAFGGLQSIVELLLDQGADINIVSESGTALAAAAFKGFRPIVKVLLDRGADINMVGGEYGTALAAAALGRKKLTVSLLLNRGADINAVSGVYGTALATAAFLGAEAVVQLLLDRGADIKVVGGEYGTALATAASAGETGIVSLLLEHGADIINGGGSHLTTNGVFNTVISLPPFSLPITGPYHHTGTLSPSSFDILSIESSITQEQADIPCPNLSEKVLWNSLTALVGLTNDTTSQARHPWVQFDVSYFVSQNFDFGLAYAAARIAWKDFNKHSMDSSIILAQRSRWHQHVQVLKEIRSKVIEIDYSSSRQELILSPYSIMPRRLWDLKSNRVIDFQMLHAAQPTIEALPTFWAISHSWTSDMSPNWTAINQYQWPVPLPKDITLDHLRSELLTFGAEYVWLDVVCLRQKIEVDSFEQLRQHGWKLDVDSLEQLRQQEWKLDVPTIGNIYRAAAKIIRYFNGLGVRFSNNSWDDSRHWLQRVWTLQEIANENTTVNGGIPQNMAYRGQAFLNSQGKVSGKAVKFRSAIRPVIQLAVQVGSLSGCEIYELAREIAKRHASQPVDKLSAFFYLLRTTKLPCYNAKATSEDAWKQGFHLLPVERKAEVLFDFPYRGTDTEWFPTWAQILDWPTRDPDYDHTRSQSSRALMRNISGETSFLVSNIWTIPNVTLCETDYPGEYKVEINKQLFNFYLPYLSQTPIAIGETPVFTLATMDTGHAYNWVVCKAIEKRVGTGVDLGVAKVNVLKKVGVMRTDSCSELLVSGVNGASLLQRMSCLFV